MAVSGISVIACCMAIVLYYVGRWQYRKRKDERETAHFIREVQLGKHQDSMQTLNGLNGINGHNGHHGLNGHSPGSRSTTLQHRKSMPPSMRLSGSMRLSTPPATGNDKRTLSEHAQVLRTSKISEAEQCSLSVRLSRKREEETTK